MQRLSSSVTNMIAVVTAAAWLLAVAAGLAEQAQLALGFIPVRLSGAAVPWPAVPALLTPLTATLVHAGLIHLGFNLLILVWCGTAVERVLGKTAVIVLYLVGAYAGSPIAPALAHALEGLWASPHLPRRGKLLILAVVAHGRPRWAPSPWPRPSPRASCRAPTACRRRRSSPPR